MIIRNNYLFNNLKIIFKNILNIILFNNNKIILNYLMEC